jgi:signal transduction protein with GAF and PtsI domain
MADRIDVLGPQPSRLAAFRGRVLDAGHDAVLDAITREAAQELSAPACVVSLVLERLQVFRSSHGLTGQLALDQALDRDLSICQYVVRDRKLVEVSDAGRDARVPSLAVEQFGVQAYLGAPISVGAEVVGSLCIIDGQPRQFSADDRAVLVRHADRVSARLGELAAEQRGSDNAAAVLRAATRPVFQDLRNALWQLGMSLDELRVAAFEAQRLSSLTGATARLADGAEMNLSQLSGALRAVAALGDLTEDAQRSASRLQKSLLALEAAAQRSGETARLADAVGAAGQLAEHFVKLVGGLGGSPLPALSVQLPKAAVIMQVSTTLASLAQALLKARVTGALLLSASEEDAVVTLRIATQGAPALHAEVAAGLRGLFGAAAGVTLANDASSLSLLYPAAADA